MRLARPALAVALAVAGCSHDGLGLNSDGATRDLQTLPDLATPPDLIPFHSGIGDPCTGGNQGTCALGQACAPQQFGFTGGYCVLQCDAQTPCPSDAKCVPVPQAGLSLCFLNCASDGDCRDTYICAPNKVCVPMPMGGNGGGVTPGTNKGAACVLPVIDPGNGLKGPFGANQQVSSVGGLQAECEITVDANNKNVIVAFNDLASGGPIGVVRSGDDGATWGQTDLLPMNMLVDKNAVASDPVTAVDKAGELLVSWVGFDRSPQSPQPTNMNVYVARSKNGGVTFPDVFIVSPPGEWKNGGFIDKPWIAVNPVDDSIVVTWDRQANNGAVDIRMVRSTDHAIWSLPLTVSESNKRPNSDRNLAQIAFGADGAGYIAWVELQMIQFGAMDNAVYLQRMKPDGTLNGVNLLVTAPPDSPTFEDPSVAVSGSEVYVGFISGTPSGAWDVRVAASLDGGATFRPSVKVNDDPTCATHFHHQIATDTKGNVHAIWYDNRFLVGNVFYAESGPAGAMVPLMFGPNSFVNDTPMTFTTRRDMGNWLGDYLGLTVSGNEIYAAWTDNRVNDRAHIFFAKGLLP